MNKISLFLIFFIFLLSCKAIIGTKDKQFDKREFDKTFIDQRDQTEYGIIDIGEQTWFTENLKFETVKSVCYKKRKQHCNHHGRLYPYDELDIACPEGWRVPNIKDWDTLKSHFQQDSIYALLDTVHWSNPVHHSNESGLSLQGTGYQLEKRLFLGEGIATSLWINQFNKYDEYYHVHIYGGKGTKFEKSNHHLNEIFHAHPISDLDNRRFPIRCVCERNK